MKKALIFGMGGFVGPYLGRELKRSGYIVYGTDSTMCLDSNRFDGFFQCDILNKEKVCQLIKEIMPSHIFNLAAISSIVQSWQIPDSTIQVNINGTLNIFCACLAIDIKPRILLVGSSEEYLSCDYPMDENTSLNANNPYGISKVTQERFAILYKTQYGMQIYCVRPFNHTGVGQRDSFVLASFCKQAAAIEKSGKSGVIKVGNLSARRDFGHVKDLMKAYRLIVESEDCNTIYNVGAGKAYSLKSLLEYIISLCSQHITIEIDQDRFRPIDNPYICCNNSKIRHELGWKPEYEVFDALKEMFYSYLNSEK